VCAESCWRESHKSLVARVVKKVAPSRGGVEKWISAVVVRVKKSKTTKKRNAKLNDRGIPARGGSTSEEEASLGGH